MINCRVSWSKFSILCFQVLCVGPTGSGKTLCIGNRLLTAMPNEYVSNFITFSARTSANQTQDMIDGKLDKRYLSRFNDKSVFDTVSVV